MARLVRSRTLESRSARAALPHRHAPYWLSMSKGRALGYRKGSKSGSWLARYRNGDGRRIQAQLGPADDVLDAAEAAVFSFATAQEAARAWFSELDLAGGDRPRRYDVNDALDDYVLAFRGKSIEKTKWIAERYLRADLGSLEVAKLTPERLAGFLRELAAQPACYRANRKGERKLRPVTADGNRARRASANRIFAVLKAALAQSYANGKVPADDAWRKVKPFGKVDSPRVRYLSEAEAHRLINACEDWFRPIVQAGLLTGARWSELCRMRAEDVDLTAGVVLIPETKAGRPRYVHLTDEGIELFRHACLGKQRGDGIFTNASGKPYRSSHQVRPMRAACERASLQGVGFHILRHSYGSRLAMAGVPLAVIAEALGHSDERITRKHYAHLAPSYVRDAIRAGLGTLGIVQRTNVASI
jgi:integrase